MPALNPVESRLEDAFKPVRPSKKFVNTLRSRIQTTSPAAPRMSDKRSLLWALGGVLSVSLLIITGVRALFYLVNRARV